MSIIVCLCERRYASVIGRSDQIISFVGVRNSSDVIGIDDELRALRGRISGLLFSCVVHNLLGAALNLVLRSGQ